MAEIAGFPYFQVQFDKQGKIFDQNEVNAVFSGVSDQNITDLIVLSHGWNNDIEDATGLYQRLLGNMREILTTHPQLNLSGRQLGFVGIFWPSKKFTEIELQPGGGASLGGVIQDQDLRNELSTLAQLSDAANAEQLIEQATLLIDELEDRKSSQDKFVDLIRELLADDESDAELDDEMPAAASSMAGRDLLDKLSRPGMLEMTSAQGGAAGIGDFFSGIKGGVMNFLNLSTYFKMKKRAGKVGMRGLHKILLQLNQQHSEVKLHLVGHSFGGRLVTAACRGADNAASVQVNTMSLLQAAFSHNGFAQHFIDQRDGYFRSVVTNQIVTGPVAITHTKNDNAVGKAYPLASRISGVDAAAIGDRNDRFGGIGRNGAQHTPEAVDQQLLAQDKTYTLNSGVYYNLQADAFIADHGDVTNKAVANLIVNMIGAV